MDLFYDGLCELVQDTRRDEPMSRHVTFRTGGPADYFAAPASVRELRAVITLCRRRKSLILSWEREQSAGERQRLPRSGDPGGPRPGKGADGGSFCLPGREPPSPPSRPEPLRRGLRAWSLRPDPRDRGRGHGNERRRYGGEMSQVVESVDVLTKYGEEKKLGNKDLKLGYRTSCILPMEYIVTGAAFSLRPGDPAAIRAKMDELAARRKEKQPLEFSSAGSTFKRPAGNFAGKLIMEAGLRGLSVGGACVSEKHCGFVVNKGGASSADIMELCRIVKERVREHSGVALELEIRLLGDFS